MEYTRDKMKELQLLIGDFKFYKTNENTPINIYDPLDNKKNPPV